MPVFTLLNCGTNFDRTKRGELVADFGAYMAGAEYQQFLITDGVGSTGASLPGSFDPFSKSKTAKSKSPKWSQTPTQTLNDVTQGTQGFTPSGHGVLKKLLPSSSAPYASITGDGWDDNIRHAIATLAQVFSGGTGVVNMVGWSRGAVTCLRMANWIREFLGDGISCNIFAVDPVAGLDAGARLHDTYFIPSTVRNYIAVLAMDEMRGDFKPQDAARMQIANPAVTNVGYLPFPGVHSTVVQQSNADLSEVPAVVRALAFKFLSSLGTAFRIAENVPTHAQMCQLYAAMMSKRKKYEKLFDKGVKNKAMGGIVERGVRTNIQAYIGADSRFFINEHHRRCFELAWGAIYAYLFTARHGAPGTMNYKTIPASSPLGRDLQQLYQNDSATYQMLEKVYGVERSTTGKFGTGQAVWKLPGPGCGIAAVPATQSAAAINVLL
jgi:hypothetical protein